MLRIKASIAAAALAATAVVSAGAGYFVTRATMQANVTMSCPKPSSTISAPVQSRRYPPLGNLPSTTGGKQY